MQKYFKFILSVCLFGVFASMPNLIHAQQVIVNAKGERIVIFPDGSWRYFEPSDSILLQKQLQSGNSSDPNEDLSSENYSDPTLIDEASRKKVASFIIKLQNELEKTKILLVKATNEKFNAEAKLKQAQENKKLIEPDLMEGLEMAYESQINEVKTY